MMERFLLVLSALCALPSSAQAYRTLSDLPELEEVGGQRVPWRAFPVAIDVFEQDGDPADAEEVLDALAAGIEIWNEAPCTRDALEGNGRSEAPANPGDDANTVQWIHSGWSRFGGQDTVAITEVGFSIGEVQHRLAEGDIYLNAETVSWDDSMLARLDGVLAHELGHLLGLAHPCEVDDTAGAPTCGPDDEMTLMHPLYDAAHSALTQDDENGLCFLYPDGAVEPTAETDADADADAEDAAAGCSVVAPPGSAAGWALGPIAAALALLTLRRLALPVPASRIRARALGA